MSQKEHYNTDEQKEPRSNATFLIVLLIFILLLVAGGFYFDTNYGGGKVQNYVADIQQTTSAGTPVPKQTSYTTMGLEETMQYEFVAFGKAFAVAMKDGVKFFTEVNSQKWTDSYAMMSPKMIQENSFFAIGDLGGNTVKVYDTTGSMYTVQNTGNVLQFALNENGYLSVISKEDTRYRISVYNERGILLKERIEESQGIYPLSSDVSDDNKTFAVSYIDASDLVPIARVLFFYIQEEDSQEYTDSIFASAVEKPSEIISKISFGYGGILRCISDEFLYGISADGIEAWNYQLDNTVDFASLASKEYSVLALGKEKAITEGIEENSIIWIDQNGKMQGDFVADDEIGYLYATDSGVVIGIKGSERFYGLRHSGGGLYWEYQGAGDIFDIIPMETLKNVAVITNKEVLFAEMGRSGESVLIPNTIGDSTEPVLEYVLDNENFEEMEVDSPEEISEDNTEEVSEDSPEEILEEDIAS
ncbi:MAG: DUF5711 family protein [Bacillota bacterium]